MKLGGLIPLVGSMLLGACAVTDEGAVELRRAVPESGANSPTIWCLTCEEQNNTATSDAMKFGGGTAIAEQVTVSISLKTVFIDDVSEGPSLSQNAVSRAFKNSEAGLQPKAEVAILANIVEAARDSSTSDTALGEGRVVFYSDDVLDGQRLNQINIPVYGPTPYSGGALFVRFSVYEVDAEGTQVAGVLSALADVGGKAFPAYSPVLNVLNRVGTSFAKSAGPGSDRHLDYRMVFDANTGQGNVRNLALRTGDYVLLRSGDRRAKLPWDHVRYDPVSGLLKKRACEEDEKTDCAYRGDSYIVFSINSALPTSGFNYTTTLSQLETKMANTSGAKARIAALQGVVDELKSDVVYDSARSSLAVAADAKRPIKEREEAIYATLEAIEEARCSSNASLRTEQQKAILRRLREIANPGSDDAAKALVGQLWPSDIDKAIGLTKTGEACAADTVKMKAVAQAVSKAYAEPAKQAEAPATNATTGVL